MLDTVADAVYKYNIQLKKQQHQMKPILSAILIIMTTGCAAPFELYANYLNTQDPCQRQNNGGNYPSFCGAGAGKVYVYKGTGGAPIGYIK